MSRPEAERPSASPDVRDDARTLEERAAEWIGPYWNTEHLVRTRDWLVELEPGAGEALRLAALTHDMERHFPGGPVQDLTVPPEAALAYRREHSERSARIVGGWLRAEGAGPELVGEVERLILAHEVGGTSDENLLQAADSISFLEMNADLLVGWFRSGRCSRERAKAQHRWMFERIQLDRARVIAEPFYEEAIAALDRA